MESDTTLRINMDFTSYVGDDNGNENTATWYIEVGLESEFSLQLKNPWSILIFYNSIWYFQMHSNNFDMFQGWW